MGNDDPKKLVLARRAKFVAAALAGMTGVATACGGATDDSEKTNPQPCLGVQADPDANPQPCLSKIADPPDATDAEPQPCLAPIPPDASDASDASDGGDGE